MSSSTNEAQVSWPMWNELNSGVKCVFFTVIIKQSSIISKFPGGFTEFAKQYPHFTTDGQLIVACFMGSDYWNLIELIEKNGLLCTGTIQDFYLIDINCFHVDGFPSIPEPIMLQPNSSGYDNRLVFEYRGEVPNRKVWVTLKSMRRLIAMIPAKGKTPKELAKELLKHYRAKEHEVLEPPALPNKEQTSDSSGRQSIPRSWEEIPVDQTTGWAIQFIPNKKSPQRKQ